MFPWQCSLPQFRLGPAWTIDTLCHVFAWLSHGTMQACVQDTPLRWFHHGSLAGGVWGGGGGEIPGEGIRGGHIRLRHPADNTEIVLAL